MRRFTTRAWALAVLSAVCLGGAAEANAQELNDAIRLEMAHCNLITGSEEFSPALDLTPNPTTLRLTAHGVGCANLRALGEGETDAVTYGTFDIEGTFRGMGSTLLSNYKGSGTVTFNLNSGGSRVLTFESSCKLMVSGNCSFIGNWKGEPGTSGFIELTPGPAMNTNLVGPVHRIDYLEFAPLLLTLMLANQNLNYLALVPGQVYGDLPVPP